MTRDRRPVDVIPSSLPPRRGWPKPPAELIRFVRSLAVDDARRDHDAAVEAARRRAGCPAATLPDRNEGRR